MTTNSVALSWNSIPAFTYHVQFNGNLTYSTWTNLPVPVVSTNGLSSVIAPLATNFDLFYRITIRP